MLHRNNLFDVLKDDKKPSSIFGEVLSHDEEIIKNFSQTADEARKRFSEMFLGKNKVISVKLIEQTCQKMWNEGWSPQKGNINLFSTDFGALLTSLILEKVGGQLIFRSVNNLMDLSIWWEDKKIEAFPFHKIFKRLSSNEGEDIEYYFNQLVKMVK